MKKCDIFKYLVLISEGRFVFYHKGHKGYHEGSQRKTYILCI